MSDRRTVVQAHSDPEETLAELLRSRALASSPRLLIGQAIAGVALNSAVMVWHPDRWGIATAAMVTVAAHALWSLSVQRTGDWEPSFIQISERDDSTEVLPTGDVRRTGRGWWLLRRASSLAGSA